MKKALLFFVLFAGFGMGAAEAETFRQFKKKTGQSLLHCLNKKPSGKYADEDHTNPCYEAAIKKIRARIKADSATWLKNGEGAENLRYMRADIKYFEKAVKNCEAFPGVIMPFLWRKAEVNVCKIRRSLEAAEYFDWESLQGEISDKESEGAVDKMVKGMFGL